MSIAPPAAGTSTSLISPHGGSLVDLMVPEEQRDAVRARVDRRVECSDRNACDVELLVVGGFSPLRGFMHREDYEAVVSHHRTSSGLLFGLPIVFDTDDASIAIGERLLLTYQGQDLAAGWAGLGVVFALDYGVAGLAVRAAAAGLAVDAQAFLQRLAELELAGLGRGEDGGGLGRPGGGA